MIDRIEELRDAYDAASLDLADAAAAYDEARWAAEDALAKARAAWREARAALEAAEQEVRGD